MLTSHTFIQTEKVNILLTQCAVLLSIFIIIIFSGSAAQRGLWPPVALQPSAGYCLLWLCSPARAIVSSFTKFLNHTQRRATVGRTPLDEWSALRSRPLTDNTHNRQISLDRATTGTGTTDYTLFKYSKTCLNRTPYIPETWTNRK
jgi:hypothetical protein